MRINSNSSSSITNNNSKDTLECSPCTNISTTSRSSSSNNSHSNIRITFHTNNRDTITRMR